jgi:putative holliday junction resolvase
MARILAIDYGTKRVGLAVTDPLQIIATALETVAANDLFTYLTQYCADESVEAFVVGFPTRLDGTDTDMTSLVRGLVQKLKAQFPQISVFEHDERYTSSMAMQSMISMGSSKKARREKSGNLDKISATIILQSFLSRHH